MIHLSSPSQWQVKDENDRLGSREIRLALALRILTRLEEIMKNLYVGNMEASTTAEDLKAAFATCGPVEVVTIVTDKVTGAGRGFGFVEMTADKDAQEAILGLNGSLMAGKAIVVNEARPKPKSTRT